jgi:hypothetical protein
LCALGKSLKTEAPTLCYHPYFPEKLQAIWNYLAYFTNGVTSRFEVVCFAANRKCRKGAVNPESDSCTSNSMKESSALEANTSSVSQEISCILWNRQVHYRNHNSPSHDPDLSSPCHCLKISFDISLHLGLPRGLLPSNFSTKTLYAPLLYPIRATCPAHLHLLDLISRKIFGEEHRA